MWRLLLIVLCWLVSVLPVQADTRVLEDFEGSCAQISARWPGQSYGGFPCSGGPFSLASSPVVNGAQSLRYNYVGSYDELGGFQCCQPGGSAEWDYHFGDKEIWITWYSYMAPGFKTAGGKNATPPDPNGIGGIATKGLYQYMYSPSTGQVRGWVFHYFYGGRQPALSAQGIKDAPEGAYGTQNMWPNVNGYNQPDGQWTGYEAHFKLNTPGQANGLYELYVTPQGGTAFLSARYANREFVDSTTSGMMPSDSYWFREKLYRQDGLGSMYLDALRVTTTRIGLGATPPPPPNQPAPDTTLPNAPTNLFITELWQGFKVLAAAVWSWLGPASAEAATAASDQVVIRWEPRPGQRFTLDLTGFGWSGAKTFADLDAGLGTLTVPLPGLPPGQPGDDRWLCATERDGKAVTGCNQLALGPVVLPPPPVPEPEPEPDLIGPAIVTMSGDKVYIACDPARYTRAKTTGTGTKRTITCLP